MTGGKGLRMAPYTQVLPKGLLPVGEQPLLEILVKQLAHHGFTRIVMACGYRAHWIQSYFGDGSPWNLSITYQVESEPLGTAGPLKTIPDLCEPFLLLNCDVLTTLSFRALWEYHASADSILTVAAQQQPIPIEFGVLETEGDRIVRFLEKPVHRARVNMGIYVMEPEVLNYIPENQYFDIPDLIRALLADNRPVKCFENDALWIDVGRPADFAKANELYQRWKDRLLAGEGR
ncbi:MAG: hypothetical protein A6D91_06315 [Bacillaceae bacterium G1]|nr:MAG: hypothetical protein A6D91_06315 [Bacillaceae bacterium G1]